MPSLHPRTPNEYKPKSPCKDVCTLDHKGKCIGCFRTLEEIANWSAYTEEEQKRVLQRVQLRMQLPDIFNPE